MIHDSQTVVVGDSLDFYLIDVRDGCILQSDGCDVVMVVPIIVCSLL